MRIFIIGCGSGNARDCLPVAQDALSGAGLVMGAPRLLQSMGVNPAHGVDATRAEEICDALAAFAGETACVLMSGDTGFYSGTKRLVALLDAYEVIVLPGISSVQALAAQLQIPWQGWHFCTAHGFDCNVAHAVSRHEECFFLTDAAHTPNGLCRQLCQSGFGHLRAAVGSDLGAETQRVIKGSVAELAEQSFSPLSVLLVQNPTPRTRLCIGLPDEAFVRGNIPMTKSEVRAVALSKLRLHNIDVVYDIGAGTGSVAVEAALLLNAGQVYAIERNAEGCALIERNAQKLQAFNLTCVAGHAPEVLEALPRPDAAFIGGSGGNLREILRVLMAKNSRVRIVITAVTLETLSEATALIKELSLTHAEVVQVAVSRSQPLGGYHIMAAQNPVYIVSGGGQDA